jgi:hypothetical protein
LDWIAVSLAPKIGKQKLGILDFGFWIGVSRQWAEGGMQKALSSGCEGEGNPKSKI